MPYGASIEVTPLRLGNAFIRVKYEKVRLNFVPQPAITLIENRWNHSPRNLGYLSAPF